MWRRFRAAAGLSLALRRLLLRNKQPQAPQPKQQLAITSPGFRALPGLAWDMLPRHPRGSSFCLLALMSPGRAHSDWPPPSPPPLPSPGPLSSCPRFLVSIASPHLPTFRVTYSSGDCYFLRPVTPRIRASWHRDFDQFHSSIRSSARRPGGAPQTGGMNEYILLVPARLSPRETVCGHPTGSECLLSDFLVRRLLRSTPRPPILLVC